MELVKRRPTHRADEKGTFCMLGKLPTYNTLDIGFCKQIVGRTWSKQASSKWAKHGCGKIAEETLNANGIRRARNLP